LLYQIHGHNNSVSFAELLFICLNVQCHLNHIAESDGCDRYGMVHVESIHYIVGGVDVGVLIGLKRLKRIAGGITCPVPACVITARVSVVVSE